MLSELVALSYTDSVAAVNQTTAVVVHCCHCQRQLAGGVPSFCEPQTVCLWETPAPTGMLKLLGSNLGGPLHSVCSTLHNHPCHHE